MLAVHPTNHDLKGRYRRPTNHFDSWRGLTLFVGVRADARPFDTTPWRQTRSQAPDENSSHPSTTPYGVWSANCSRDSKIIQSLRCIGSLLTAIRRPVIWSLQAVTITDMQQNTHTSQPATVLYSYPKGQPNPNVARISL